MVSPPWIISAFRRPCLPIVSPHVCLCWMLCPPSRGLVSVCLPLSPHMCACAGMSAFSGLSLVCQCLPLSPHMCACVGWCVPLPKVLSPLLSHCFPHVTTSTFPRSCLPLVSHCLPSCFPVLDGVSAFPRFCLPCLPACLPVCLPSCLPACLPTCLSSCFPLWRVVAFCIFFPNNVRSGVLNAFSCPVFDPVPQPVLNPQTVWGLRWCHLDYGGVI